MSALDLHYANRADLVARRDALEALWAAEDARLAEDRARLREAYDNGLRDVDAVIVAAGGVVPGAMGVETAEPAPVLAMAVPVQPLTPVVEPPATDGSQG